MTTQIQKNMAVDPVVKYESALVMGDLSKLGADERLNYYQHLCGSLGLNHLTKPFEYITLNGKLTLYARKDATDQLRNIRNVSVRITGRDTVNDVFIVTAQAFMRQGDSERTDESIGAVSIKNLGGDNLANALMKAETKAKRRVTLSICGLGMLDESELETIAELKNADLKPASDQKKAVAQPTQSPAPISEQERVKEWRAAMTHDLLRNDIDELMTHPAVDFEQLAWWKKNRAMTDTEKLRAVKTRLAVKIAQYEKAANAQIFGGDDVQDFSAFAD
jgi:hypothetical protein